MRRETLDAIKRRTYSIFFTICFLIIFPPCLLLFVPIDAFRFILSYLAKIFRPDLGMLIHTRSQVLAIDRAYCDPKWNLCVWFVIEGSLNFEKFRAYFLRTIVDHKNEDDGKFTDPEYQQYYTKWLGFLFWKWDREFNIKNHMRYFFEDRDDYLKKETTEEELRKIIQRFTWAPFKPKRSPWEFLYIPNYRSSTDESLVELKCVLIFRVHHGLCDGFKILNLLMKETNGISLDYVAQPDYWKRSIWMRVLISIMLWLRGPYEFFNMLVASKDHNEWHRLPDRKLIKPMNMGFTKRIPLQEIKDIKNVYKVSFTAVLMASITSGIRRMMMESGVKIPKTMSTAVAVPMPGHPARLRNHFIFSFIKLPVGVEDPRERLFKMEKNIKDLKRSTSSLFSFTLLPVVGGLMACMQGCFNHNVYSTALISNFPGPPHYSIFIADGGAHKVTDMNFAAGLGAGGVGLGFLMMSYAGGMRVISQADRSLLYDNSHVDTLNARILEEMDLLKREAYYRLCFIWHKQSLFLALNEDSSR